MSLGGIECRAEGACSRESEQAVFPVKFGIAYGQILDAAIVANAQALEHYEVCRYGTLIARAKELGHDGLIKFLTTNLNEEKAANTKLNTVALRKGVNKRATGRLLTESPELPLATIGSGLSAPP